jgi:hypothetical protein
MSVEVESRSVVREYEVPRKSEMVELPLLLPQRQLAELEQAARRHGLTVGQMLRRLIAAYLHEPA